MPQKPIKRFYAQGYTFRWIQDDAVIAVLRGHVAEAHRIWQYPSHTGPELTYRHEDSANDRHTWIDAIPAPAGHWNDATALRRAANHWIQSRSTSRTPA